MKVFSRLASFEKELISAEERRASFILISRENAVPRRDFDGTNYIEKLRASGADTSRLHSLFFNHKTEELPIGYVENVRVEDETLKGDFIFDTDVRSEQIFQKVISGSIRSASIMYSVPDESIQVDTDGEVQVRTLSNFEVFEASVVTMPADKGAVIGRSSEIKETLEEEKIDKRGPAMGVESNSIREEEQRRCTEILSLSDRFKCRDLGLRAIQEGASLDQFRSEVLNNMENTKKNPVDSIPKLDLSKRDQKKYSVCRAINALCDQSFSRAPFEKEVSDELSKLYGKSARGFFLPVEIMTRDVPDSIMNKAAADGSVGPSQYIMGEEYRPQSFIDLLINRMWVKQLGAQILPNLKSDVKIPKETGTANASWISEMEPVQETGIAFSNIHLTPKTVAKRIPWTRRTFIQADPNIDNIVMNDFSRSLALAIDAACINGVGGNEPLGIMNTTGVTPVGNKKFDWDCVVAMETKIAEGNADSRSMAYLCSPSIYGAGKTVPKVAGQASFLIDSDKTCNGYRIERTNQMPAGKIIFGDFSHLMIGLFSSLDINVDRSTLSSIDGTIVSAFQDIDVAVRYPQAFTFNQHEFKKSGTATTA
jgi:HK97 family phage major capsid protein/HK97 family phage prohead protease